VSEHPAPTLRPAALSGLLDALPDGVLAVDRTWTIAYVNPAGAALLQRPVGALTGRNLWAAVPEVADSILHGFLLHGAAAAVSWTGFYPPAQRWLTVTAGPVGGLLQVTLRAEAASGRTPGEGGPGEDADRFRFLAEVSEALIASLDTGETATRLAELATGRLCDWAVIALADDAGGVGDRAWAHRDPAMRGDLNTYLTGRRSDTGDDAAMIDALLTGQPVRVPMVHHEVVAPSLPTEAVRTAWRRLDTTSCTVVPLRARGETFGAVAMLNTGTGRRTPTRRSPWPSRSPAAARSRWTTPGSTASSRPSPRRCSAACSPTRRNPTTSSCGCATSRPALICTWVGIGTTSCSSPTAPPSPSSATSWATTWTRRRAWARSAAWSAPPPTAARTARPRC
jgi:PAS domain-containing protein